MKKQFIPRDISWLSFNARVLQEANDPSVRLKQRLRFLGIFSNNLDEFFRVRVATLRRMIELGGKKPNMHLEENPQYVLEQIQRIVLRQQSEFNRIWDNILREMKKEKIYLLNEQRLNREQKRFVEQFFEENVRANIIPLMIESIPQLPYLRDKSLYLGVVMRRTDGRFEQKYALLEVPGSYIGRFIQLPAKNGEQNIILLEDVVRFNLPRIFSHLGYDQYVSHVFKVTKDAEIDLDNDISTTIVQKIQKGLKNRRKGKPVRFVYDKEMDAGLLEFLIRKLNLSRKDNIIPGGRIHNFRNFMDFPDVFSGKSSRRHSFTHPELATSIRVTDVILKKDLLLHFPYHRFDSIIDMLREAAMDTDVLSIKITAYRLAPNSRIVNALVNAARNGKQVTVMLELRARFEEEANLEWKDKLEEEGVTVIYGVANLKVHAKLCVIRKRIEKKVVQYGFISSGNLNESTAKVYGDHCLLTSNPKIMADINRIFRFLLVPRKNMTELKACKTILVCPTNMRKQLHAFIQKEISNAKAGKAAGITLKLNSLSDHALIGSLNEAAKAGVKVNMIIRGIYCAMQHGKKQVQDIRAISIVDEYLEHSRVMIFENGGKPRVFISSADWMVRNLDHRVEAAVPVLDSKLQQELSDVIHIQLKDNVKARILDQQLSNNYVPSAGKKKVRSQQEIFNYLQKKTGKPVETSSH